MSVISPFRLTPDDLPGLDKKTREGLQPLLDALHITIQQLVQEAAAAPTTKELSSTFQSSATGTAFVDFNPAPLTRVRSLVVDQIRRSDSAPMTTAYAMTWEPQASGVMRALFVGLDANANYYLAVTLS